MLQSQRRAGLLKHPYLLAATETVMQAAAPKSSCHTLALLPFEPASEVLSSEHPDAGSLIRTSQVCKSWKKLCDNDEIWRRAAHRWGCVADFALTVEDAKRAQMDENGYFANVKTWRELCIARECLDAELGDARRGERTQYPLSYSFHAAQSESNHGIWQDVWQMKIIHENGTIASTGMGGGVRVTDLRTHELLWSIPPEMTKRFLHLEAEKGFLVWNSGELAPYLGLVRCGN
jgi:F-box-like